MESGFTVNVSLTTIESTELIAVQKVFFIMSTVDKLLIVTVRAMRRLTKVESGRLVIVTTFRLPYIKLLITSSLLRCSKHRRASSI